MTLLLKSAQILGAPKKFSDKADIFISGDKISAIGNFPDKKADKTLDCQGAYVSPGFIDVNTDSDHYLSIFDNPSQEDFLRQGVTTIVGGHCGSSLAPLLYGSLESIQKWTDVSKVNVDWHTLEEFFAILDKKQLGVNFVTLVGHSTIRRGIVGEVLRELTKNEIVVCRETVRRALREGGAGFSTGLGYVHSRHTPYQEIKSLVEAVKEYRGVYSTHLRKTGVGLSESVNETLRIHEETGASVLINHFLPRRGAEGEYEAALERMSNLPKESDFHFDLYPFDTIILPLYTFLPLWAQSGGIDTMNSNLADEWLQSRIRKELPKFEPNDFVVARAAGNDSLVGYSLKELMGVYAIKDHQEALLKLMLTTKLKASIFFKDINMKLVRQGLTHPRSLIASNAASLGVNRKEEKIERSWRTFPKFLELAEKEKLLTLETAIRKITKEPARKFNLRNRGEIKEGNFADIACFQDGVIKFTAVNGQVAYEREVFQNIFAGKALRHHGY